jgi:dCMP deaminase
LKGIIMNELVDNMSAVGQAIRKKYKYDTLYMNIAESVADMSIDHKYKVGAIIVKEGILAEGWNGAPTGFPNATRNDDEKTHPWVIHAEQNAIAKCARKGIACEGATIYVTLAPCRDCARMIIQSGIKEVVYRDRFYKDEEGLNMLTNSGVTVEHYARKPYAG